DTPGPLAVDEVIARATELKAYDLRRDGIDLTVDVPPDLPRISASAFQLQQVLLNLITNAQDELRARDGRREIVVAAALDARGWAPSPGPRMRSCSIMSMKRAALG